MSIIKYGVPGIIKTKALLESEGADGKRVSMVSFHLSRQLAYTVYYTRRHKTAPGISTRDDIRQFL